MLLLNFFIFCLMATSSSADLAQSLKSTLERENCICRGIENPEFRRDEAGRIYLLGRTPTKSTYSSLEKKLIPPMNIGIITIMPVNIAL